MKIFILAVFISALCLFAFMVAMLVKVMAEKDELERKISERDELEVWW